MTARFPASSQRRARRARDERWWLAGSVLAALLPACSEAAREREPTDPRQECIFFGSSEPDYLVLEAAEQSALVKLDLQTEHQGATTYQQCSGTVIAERWVLTAKHCSTEPGTPSITLRLAGANSAAQPAAPSACVGGEPRSAAAGEVFSAARVVRHPTLDLLLVELDRSTAEAEHPPHVLRVAEPSELAVGDWMQLAGFGRTENVESGVLRFAVEPVSEIVADHVSVQGAGRSGACVGDSGGPLLTRDQRGELNVVGVLSDGSADCTGIDRYVRARAAVDWISEIVGDSLGKNSAPASCSSLTREGRCFRGTALWCDDTARIAETCEVGTACGWSVEAGGYRCVEPALDPCAGVDDRGECASSSAVRCDAGQLVRTPCASCARSAHTGAATCSTP